MKTRIVTLVFLSVDKLSEGCDPSRVGVLKRLTADSRSRVPRERGLSTALQTNRKQIQTNNQVREGCQKKLGKGVVFCQNASDLHHPQLVFISEKKFLALSVLSLLSLLSAWSVSSVLFTLSALSALSALSSLSALSALSCIVS